MYFFKKRLNFSACRIRCGKSTKKIHSYIQEIHLFSFSLYLIIRNMITWLKKGLIQNTNILKKRKPTFMNFPFFKFQGTSCQVQGSGFIFHNGKIGHFSENRKFQKKFGWKNFFFCFSVLFPFFPLFLLNPLNPWYTFHLLGRLRLEMIFKIRT